MTEKNESSPVSSSSKLSRRERQIMDVLYERQRASAKEILEALDDAPSYSTVRALLARMLEKKLVVHESEAGKYIYRPLTQKQEAGQSALGRLVRTFFEGSAAKAANALIGDGNNELSDAELDVLEAAIKQARARDKKDS